MNSRYEKYLGRIEDNLKQQLKDLNELKIKQSTPSPCITCKNEPTWDDGKTCYCGSVPIFLRRVKLYRDGDVVFYEKTNSFSAGHGTHTETYSVKIDSCDKWEAK